MKSLISNKQKAWLGSLSAFATSLVALLITGEDIDPGVVDGLASIAGEVATAATIGVANYIVVYLKTNRPVL